MIRNPLLYFVFLTLLGLGSQPASGGELVQHDGSDAAAQPTIELPWVLSSGMVIQRDRRAPVWGSAKPGAEVQVAFAEQAKRTVSDDAGAWRIELDAMPASAVGRDMTISVGDESRVLTDVLVGEVWLCAGQSNMGWPLGSSVGGDAAAARVAESSTLRLLDPQPTVGLGRSVWPLADILALTPGRYFSVEGWSHGDAAAAGRFSGVAAFFGLYLQSRLEVPIGLIDVAVGGTPTEAWVPRQTVLANPQTADLEKNFLGSVHAQDFVRDRPLVHLAQWDQAGRPGGMPEHPFRPGFMFAAGIEPLASLPIAGMLWYQGESNAEDADLHDTLFTDAVAAWRDNFGRDDLPVFWVQLPDLNREMWPEFRASQQRLVDAIPNTALAVTIGLGNATNVHPQDKGPVGERLARLALQRVYGRDIQDTGPTLTEHRPVNNTMQLTFDHTTGGLDLRLPGHDEPRRDRPTGFWVAGRDRVFYRADLEETQGNTLWVSHPEVPEPVAVRYAWEANTPATLYSGEGLPAAPFKTDDWETIRIACVGDSITYGTGTGSVDSNSYPAQLSRDLGPLFDVRNFGVPGSGVVNGLLQAGTGWDRGYAKQMAYRRSIVFNPDIVIINLGINDVTNDAFDIDAFVRDYVALIESYRESPGEPTVYIWQKLAPLFPGQAFHNHPRLAEIQTALDRVVRQTGVKTLDLHRPFADRPELFPDHIHPNAEGAGVIARVTRQALEAAGIPVAGE